MREVTRAQVSRILRIAAASLVALRLLGSWMWLSGFDEADGGEKLHYLMATAPLTIGLAGVLYAAAVLLGRPDAPRPQPLPVAEPAVAASVLDLDAPIDHVVFQPAGPAPMTAIPIGDPHAAFRRE